MSTIDSDPTTMTPEQLRDAVRDRYAAAARQATEALGAGSGCCSSTAAADPVTAGSAVGALHRIKFAPPDASGQLGMPSKRILRAAPPRSCGYTPRAPTRRP